MYEFWAEKNNDNLVQYIPTKDRMKNFPVFASNFYDKPVIGAEAYTGHAHYSESPADLKLFGDRAFCSGINQMILHSYVHQPNDVITSYSIHYTKLYELNEGEYYFSFEVSSKNSDGHFSLVIGQGTDDRANLVEHRSYNFV